MPSNGISAGRPDFTTEVTESTEASVIRFRCGWTGSVTSVPSVVNHAGKPAAKRPARNGHTLDPHHGMKNSAWAQMAVYAITIFADDGTMDDAELDCLLGLAAADGTIDADERRVLARILDRVDEHRVAPSLWTRIAMVREQMAL